MKSLYRRYRPIKLEDVVGQDQVIKPLANAIKDGKISHAYLFIGPRGCGKTSVARIFAHEVNNFKYEIEDNYVDIIEIDGASNRGIDNIRELREKVAIAPTEGKYKVYIIDEVHMLTKEAFNALLKTLEEPPRHVIFIMATTDAYKVPVTITSRAQTYTFKLADEATMFGHLKKICEKENIKIADDALKIVVKRGGGSFRDSLSLLDQISTLSEGEITKALVVSAMGLPEDEKIRELLDSVSGGDVVKITTFLKGLLSSGIKAETLAEEMISEILNNPKPELLSLLAKLPEVKAPYAEARLLVAMCGAVSGTARPTITQAISKPQVSAHTEPASTTIREFGKATPQPSTESTPHDTALDAAAPSDRKNTASEPVVTPGAMATATTFNWNVFVEDVMRLNDGIAAQLKSVDFEVNGGTLDIYPNKKIVKTILSRENNKRILVEAAKGLRVEVHEVEDNPNRKNDTLISKMSAIMGGEVQNDGGENPF